MDSSNFYFDDIFFFNSHSIDACCHTDLEARIEGLTCFVVHVVSIVGYLDYI